MRCVHEKHFATCPECKAGEFEKQRDLAANKWATEERASATEYNQREGRTRSKFDVARRSFKVGAGFGRKFAYESDSTIENVRLTLEDFVQFFSEEVHWVAPNNRAALECLKNEGQKALAAFAKERGEL